MGHGDTENRLIPTVVEKFADSFSLDMISCGGFHMAATATVIGNKSSIVPVDDEDDDEEEDIYE